MNFPNVLLLNLVVQQQTRRICRLVQTAAHRQQSIKEGESGVKQKIVPIGRTVCDLNLGVIDPSGE